MIDPQGHLNSIRRWTDTLGLLPVSLFNDQEAAQPVVLLNGSNGNFVLDLHGDGVGLETRNYAWSSNVGHYVALRGNTIEVQRWDQNRAAIERYNANTVLANLEGFHTYLERQTPSTELSIVSHTIRIFRSLRTMLGDGISGPQSLEVFLYLLAVATEQITDDPLSLRYWGLSSEAASLAKNLPIGQWDTLLKEIKRGRPLDQLAPHLNLLLRHASGQLFQEAHYVAVFLPQLQFALGGFLPEPVEVVREQRGLGLHFTPPALVRTLVEEAIASLNGAEHKLVIFDPACGSGEFLREVLRQLKIKQYKKPIEIIGWDISPAACSMANFVLAWEKRGMNGVEVTVRCVNSLDDNNPWPEQVSMVLMNPPFVSSNDMQPELRSRVRAVLGELAGERPDLSHAFILKAVACLQNDGILSTIFPASFLSSASARHIRGVLGEQLEPRLIGRLGSQLLFPGALVDIACYVAVKHSNKGGQTLAFWSDPQKSSSASGLRTLRKLRTDNDPANYPEVHPNFSIYLHPTLGRTSETWALASYESWKLYENLGNLPKVTNLFSVHQGTQTGLNNVFLLPRETWETLPTRERRYFRPAVVNASIRDGRLYPVTYVFYPYGHQAITNEEDLSRLMTVYYNQYLLPKQDQLSQRPAVQAGNYWWQLNRPRIMNETNGPKLVSTSFGDIGSFAIDIEGKFVVVQGNTWEPKTEQGDVAVEAHEEYSSKEQDYVVIEAHESSSPKLNIYFAYLAILNSSLFFDLIAAVSTQVTGGQWDLAKRYVDRIPLPDLFDEQRNASLVARLARLGRDIVNSGTVDDKKVRELLKPLYSLNIG